jgi:hypothetical protein
MERFSRISSKCKELPPGVLKDWSDTLSFFREELKKNKNYSFQQLVDSRKILYKNFFYRQVFPYLKKKNILIVTGAGKRPKYEFSRGVESRDLQAFYKEYKEKKSKCSIVSDKTEKSTTIRKKDRGFVIHWNIPYSRTIIPSGNEGEDSRRFYEAEEFSKNARKDKIVIEYDECHGGLYQRGSFTDLQKALIAALKMTEDDYIEFEVYSKPKTRVG